MLTHLSHIRLSVISWTVARQAPLSMGFSRQEYWSGLPCPPPGDLPNPGIEPVSLNVSCIAGGFFATTATWGAHANNKHIQNIKCNTSKRETFQNQFKKITVREKKKKGSKLRQISWPTRSLCGLHTKRMTFEMPLFLIPEIVPPSSPCHSELRLSICPHKLRVSFFSSLPQ